MRLPSKQVWTNMPSGPLDGGGPMGLIKNRKAPASQLWPGPEHPRVRLQPIDVLIGFVGWVFLRSY